jgi:hypothetical protein
MSIAIMAHPKQAELRRLEQNYRTILAAMKANRRKFHPDVNRDEGANDTFIMIGNDMDRLRELYEQQRREILEGDE